MLKRPAFSVHNRLRSFGFAICGLKHFVASEHNAWVHLGGTLVVVLAASFFGLSSSEWLWIILAIGWVWMGEAFNTAIERLADVVTLDRDPRIAVVKDVAAAGVLISSVGAALIGSIIFLPHLVSALDL